MPNQALHDALRDFATEACTMLRQALDGGAELAFEVLEEGARGTRPMLYRYRPLTAAFVGERWDAVRRLDAHRRAADALGAGAAAYMRHRGLRSASPDDALRDLMERLLDDATSFDLPGERFERLAAELDAVAGEAAVRATVIAPLHGIRIPTGWVELGDGVALARRSALDPPPAALEGAARAAGFDPDGAPPEPSPLDVLCVLERDHATEEALPVDEARTVFRRVLTGLRLSGAGGTALGPLAWARAGDGAWHPVALGVSARARPESWELRYGEESELVDLLTIMIRSRHGNAVAWALDRFEMGCERERETEALSDYLLGLRALLGDAGGDDEAMARRVAALCAPPEERSEVRERVALARALERQAMYGEPADGVLALDSPRSLVREIEQHLRSLLRDALCGYLDEDLRRSADELIAAAQPPSDGGLCPPDPSEEVLAGDLRRPPEEEDTRELVPVQLAAPAP